MRRLSDAAVLWRLRQILAYPGEWPTALARLVDLLRVEFTARARERRDIVKSIGAKWRKTRRAK